MLAELVFCADRAYMLVLPDEPAREPVIQLDEFNFGLLPLVNDQSRLQRRFYEESAPLEAARAADLMELLRDDNTHIYVCGLKSMEEGVVLTLRDVAQQAGLGWEELDSKLKREGRLQLETY